MRRREKKLEVYFKFETSGRTCEVSGNGVHGQLLELGLVIGRKVPAAKVVCQSVVAPRNLDSGHVKSWRAEKNQISRKQSCMPSVCEWPEFSARTLLLLSHSRIKCLPCRAGPQSLSAAMIANSSRMLMF